MLLSNSIEGKSRYPPYPGHKAVNYRQQPAATRCCQTSQRGSRSLVRKVPPILAAATLQTF